MGKKALWAGLAALAMFAGGAPARAGDDPLPVVKPEPGTIALTYDDLPSLTVIPDQRYIDDTTKKLLKGLKHHHLAAFGFVIGGSLERPTRKEQIADLDRWLDAGFPLGNHTYSHETPEQMGAREYVEDIARGDPVVRELMARRHLRLEWFRAPYLATGATAETKTMIERWLSEHHYRMAPVTIDAEDWEFAEPYDDALVHNDKKRAKAIKALYLAYTARTITWSRLAAKAVFGRDIAHVMLLHATRLNADTIGDFAKILKQEKLRTVPLDTAMADPAYKTPDNWLSKDGTGWLERWGDALHKELPWDSYREPPEGIVKDYDRVDAKAP